MASPSPSPDLDISIGDVLDGRYRIDAILGSGGMGRVYRGEHTGIGRAVAIKVLHADLNRNREAAQRFQREAIASGRLDHPNIVGVSDFGVLEDGACYLVMEVLEGESLGARLEREKRIVWFEALAIMRGVLAGLRHAHDRGVVHRDIKPDNVFLARKEGELVVKILDFGIAKLYAGSPDDPASTRAGLTVGTPAYLSPEQAVGGAITPASDIYSTTVLLFEMIAGRAPFEDKDPLAMLGAHVSRLPPRLLDVAPDLVVPPVLEDVLQHGLVKAAAERIPSAADYLTLLDGILSGTLMAASAAPPPPAEMLGVAPTASFLPTATPPPGTLSMTGPITPAPDVSGALQPVSAVGQTQLLPHSTRAVSLLEVGEPIPSMWIKVGGIVVAVMVVGAIVLAIWSKLSGNSPTPAKGSAAATPLVVPMTMPRADKTVDRETRLKAALHDLEAGKTCADRKEAIAQIVDLDDKAAIPALKKARYRMGGGVLGIGADNYNACLKADAEAAIKSLGGTLK
jgi:serine/threonine protein kinase